MAVARGLFKTRRRWRGEAEGLGQIDAARPRQQRPDDRRDQRRGAHAVHDAPAEQRAPGEAIGKEAHRVVVEDPPVDGAHADAQVFEEIPASHCALQQSDHNAGAGGRQRACGFPGMHAREARTGCCRAIAYPGGVRTLRSSVLAGRRRPQIRKSSRPWMTFTDKDKWADLENRAPRKWVPVRGGLVCILSASGRRSVGTIFRSPVEIGVILAAADVSDALIKNGRRFRGQIPTRLCP